MRHAFVAAAIGLALLVCMVPASAIEPIQFVRRDTSKATLLTRGAGCSRATAPGIVAATSSLTDWYQEASNPSPPARHEHAMAYDSARGRVVLFGGYPSTGDTWEWDGTTWVERTSSVSPSARWGHAMAYDSARGRVVLFGGVNDSGRLDDTWEWDGNTWVQRIPDTRPPARFDHAMAYDSGRERVVIFGGAYYSGLGDTWEWDGATWVERTPPTSPSARYQYAMAYDSARQRVVIFGGIASGVLAETWEWDGDTWVQRTPSTSPPARYNNVMSFHAARGRVMLFGGIDETMNRYLADTWEWDGMSWVEMTTTTRPSARSLPAMAYDSARERAVVFGGQGGPPDRPYLADTWEYGCSLTLFYRDDDGDGFGNPNLPVEACVAPPGYVSSSTDCDDTRIDVHPGAPEVCDGLDSDCNGLEDDDAAGVDSDGDSIHNACDNCRFAFNPDQLESDGDGIGNACDNCVTTSNPDQADPDSDGRGTVCDNCPLSANPFQDDFDGDRVGDVCDNCIFDWNAAQADFDHDNQGDLCDLNDGLIYVFSGDENYMEWQPEAGYTTWNSYRGSLAVLRATGQYTQAPGSNPLAARNCSLSENYVFDSLMPGAGEVAFSLVTGVTGGVESSLGTNSAGVPRTNGNPCP